MEILRLRKSKYETIFRFSLKILYPAHTYTCIWRYIRFCESFKTLNGLSFFFMCVCVLHRMYVYIRRVPFFSFVLLIFFSFVPFLFFCFCVVVVRYFFFCGGYTNIRCRRCCDLVLSKSNRNILINFTLQIECHKQSLFFRYIKQKQTFIIFFVRF